MSGKGSAPRNCFSEAFRSGWERIFGGAGKSTVSGQVTADKQDGGSTPPTSTFVKPSENVNEYEHEIDWSND